MTGTSEVEARPTSAQSQGDGVESERGPAQHSAQLGKESDDRLDGQEPRAGDQVWSLAGEARDRIADKLEPAKRSAKSFAEDQKEAGARKIGNVAQIVHDAAAQLQPELPQAAKSIHEAAGALEQASIALRERSVDELVNSCLNFARAQPVAFFGIAAVAGFAVARFVKSSAPPQTDSNA